TRRGFREEDIKYLCDLMLQVIKGKREPSEVRKEVIELRKKFSEIKYGFKSVKEAMEYLKRA
ncbi:serine hydroxymethyltransferase, partial [Candidatus Bathyarchaeota archaeon]|nr:serine hydroxymethyltransferase [Candidatus Bathyarchaeota archaeon]